MQPPEALSGQGEERLRGEGPVVHGTGVPPLPAASQEFFFTVEGCSHVVSRVQFMKYKASAMRGGGS